MSTLLNYIKRIRPSNLIPFMLFILLVSNSPSEKSGNLTYRHISESQNVSNTLSKTEEPSDTLIEASTLILNCFAEIGSDKHVLEYFPEDKNVKFLSDWQKLNGTSRSVQEGSILKVVAKYSQLLMNDPQKIENRLTQNRELIQTTILNLRWQRLQDSLNGLWMQRINHLEDEYKDSFTALEKSRIQLDNSEKKYSASGIVLLNLIQRLKK